jgi:hypothetical protein
LCATQFGGGVALNFTSAFCSSPRARMLANEILDRIFPSQQNDCELRRELANALRSNDAFS